MGAALWPLFQRRPPLRPTKRGAYYTHVDGYELDTCGDDVWILGGTFRLRMVLGGNFGHV